MVGSRGFLSAHGTCLELLAVVCPVGGAAQCPPWGPGVWECGPL